MRFVFGMLSLLMGLAVVGVLVKKQLGAMQTPPLSAPGSQVGSVSGTDQPALQGQQLQQQVKKSVEDAMQRPRMPDQE